MARHRNQTQESVDTPNVIMITLVIVGGVVVTSLVLAAFGDTEAAGMVVRTALLLAAIVGFMYLRRIR